MKIKKKSRSKAVVKLEQSVDINNASHLKGQLIELIEEGYEEIILDFSEVEYLDSNGLGAIFSAHKRLAEERERTLKIINVSSKYVRDLFSVVNVQDVLNIEKYKGRSTKR